MGKRSRNKHNDSNNDDQGRKHFPFQPYDDPSYYEAMNYIVGLALHIKDERGDSFPILKEMVNSIFGNRDPEKTLFSEEMAESLARKACLFLVEAVDAKHSEVYCSAEDSKIRKNDEDDDNDESDDNTLDFPHLPI